MPSKLILLVEDDPAVRAVTARMLEYGGYGVLQAGHPAEALVIARQAGESIDLMITDVEMPQLNGRQLADRLRADRPSLKVLFVSGSTGDEILRRRVACAQDVFLQKPYSIDSLVSAVRNALG